MAYLFVLNGAERCRAYFLTGDAMTLGKDEAAEVRLIDPWVSARHARIVREGEGWAIEDLGSTNGTYVNLERVERRTLQDEDVVFLGGTHLLLVTSNRAPSAPPRALPRDPILERYGATDRLARPASDIDISPLGRGAAAFSADPELTAAFDDPLLASFDNIEGEAELDADAFRPPPPRDDDPELERLLGAAVEARLPKAPHSDPDRKPPLAPPAPEPLSGSIEIDVTDLLDPADEPEPPPPAPELPPPPAERPSRLPSSDTSPLRFAFDPVEPAGAAPSAGAAGGEGGAPDRRDRELQRLRRLLAARDAELERLREELLRLKERYLDL